MNKLSGMLLAVLLLAVANARGACYSDVVDVSMDRISACSHAGCPEACQYKATCDTVYQMAVCPETKSHNGYIYTQSLGRIGNMGLYVDGSGQIYSCPSTSTSCFGEVPPSAGGFNWACRYSLRCDTQCDADSVVCQTAGGTWMNTGASTCGGKSCKMPACTQADSQWLDSAKAACTAIGGENSYAIAEVDEICVHNGTCCPPDSIPSGNTCKWRCDSVLTQCNGRAGALFGAVLPDTSVSGQDTTFSYQCFYNCAHSPNPDSTVYIVEGNTVLAGPNDSIADGIKSEWFSSIRSTTGSIYVYDYLSPSASEYVDSIAAMKCVEHLWRCVINNKYVYWYDNQEVPAGCTNIVRVK